MRDAKTQHLCCSGAVKMIKIIRARIVGVMLLGGAKREAPAQAEASPYRAGDNAGRTELAIRRSEDAKHIPGFSRL
jgi:hypothetical protein